MNRITLIILLLYSICIYAYTPDYSKIEDHPRLLLKKGDEIKVRKLIGNDFIMKKVHDGILLECNKYINKPLLERVKIGRRLLSTSREALKRIFYLSYIYRITNNEKYAERAKTELLNVCTFSDWNPSHFLDVGEMTMAVAIGYDWLFYYLSANDRKIIEDAIFNKGIVPSYNKKYNSFYQKANNWNQVCNSGLVYGALAIFENKSKEAKHIINKAIETNSVSLKCYAPDGGYPEGYGYWGYGTSFQVMMIAALKTSLNDECGLSESPGLLDSARFMQFMIAPSWKSFNFSDNNAGVSTNPVLFWFADKLNDSSILWLEMKMLKDKTFKELDSRFLPCALIFRAKSGDKSVIEPYCNYWSNRGITPIFVYRSGWNTPQDTYLGVKGGSANASHAHMDAGSFIYEKNGVRWSMDLGMQNYNSLESKGIDLWNRKQDSQRWEVFRIGNSGHTTITMNNEKHVVNGYAEIVEEYRLPYKKGTKLDMTSIFGNLTYNTTRTIFLDGNDNLNIIDEISNAENNNEIQWTMITSAKAKIVKGKYIVLEKDGKRMSFSVEVNDKIDLFIKDNNPDNNYDEPNPGTVRIGFTSTIKPNSKTKFVVRLKTIL